VCEIKLTIFSFLVLVKLSYRIVSYRIVSVGYAFINQSINQSVVKLKRTDIQQNTVVVTVPNRWPLSLTELGRRMLITFI